MNREGHREINNSALSEATSVVRPVKGSVYFADIHGRIHRGVPSEVTGVAHTDW